MLDVANFLMRWLFLCNLVRDVAEIQTLPYAPQGSVYEANQAFSRPASCEEEWRDNCLHGILSYPPGTQRALTMDAMRAELVNRLSSALREADQTLRRHEAVRRKQREERDPIPPQLADGLYDPYMDADVEILKAFEQETQDGNLTIKGIESSEEEQSLLVISTNGTVDSGDARGSCTHSEPMLSDMENGPIPSLQQVEDAQSTIRTAREYLPQLVSVLLKSPPAFEPHLLNPIDKLRKVIMQRCVEDANWGVDMCWLLEAEVGRAWKTLFEHRQQTGRRLIVVLPAEKAAVLAKIGTEKKEAFNLLQDTEQATAYGHTVGLDEEYLYSNSQPYAQYGSYQQPPHVHDNSDRGDPDESQSRLPSSISLRRCSHFGDTMHFIDRLTKVSLDMRQVPTIQRHAYLQENLKEMNRRIRRRMVTRGDVSLDVEDNRGPDDWPKVSDVTSDMLRYSVHLPLDPKQQKRWPGGDEATDISDGGVVRVLNLVVEECRTLASRERCPFLIHLEVAETNLRGNDPRLYAIGAPSLGATVEEALAMSATAASAAVAGNRHPTEQGYAPYQIPSVLLSSPNHEYRPLTSLTIESNQSKTEFVCGGWQSNDTMYYSQNHEDVFNSNPYDNVRQSEYEQLHQQMHAEQNMVNPPNQMQAQRDPMVSTRETLLDRVYGQAWDEKCEEIRQASPFGKTEGWRLASFIVKAGEDIRREQLVMQIISKLNEWFQTDIAEQFRPHMRPYTIMCVGGDAGLVECLSDAKSIDEVKKRTDSFVSLRDYFERAYGPPTAHSVHYLNSQPGKESSLTFEEAQDNFLRSLVGYSLVCFILQIKDRHNANILLDREGNIMHIDFGFVLGDTPKMGKVPIFSERAPFKLSTEFWDVLGGWNVNQGGLGVKFCSMFEEAFACAAAHVEEIAGLVEATMLTLTQSPRQARLLANGVRSRLQMRGPPGSHEQKTFIIELVNAALTSWGTPTYDWLQKNMNGYQ